MGGVRALDLNRYENPQSKKVTEDTAFGDYKTALRSDMPGVWNEAPSGNIRLTEARDKNEGIKRFIPSNYKYQQENLELLYPNVLKAENQLREHLQA